MVGYEDASVMEEYWLRSLGLLLEDRQCLRKGGWLTDSVINVGQVLLKTDYPQIGGQLWGKSLALLRKIQRSSR